MSPQETLNNLNITANLLLEVIWLKANEDLSGNPFNRHECIFLRDVKTSKNVPADRGIYIVFFEEMYLYIGMSINIRRRWMDHQRYEQILTHWPDARIAFLTSTFRLELLEDAFIAALKPVLNDLSPRYQDIEDGQLADTF